MVRGGALINFLIIGLILLLTNWFPGQRTVAIICLVVAVFELALEGLFVGVMLEYHPLRDRRRDRRQRAQAREREQRREDWRRKQT